MNGLRSRAHFLRHLADAASRKAVDQARAFGIRLLAERQMGEFLKAMPKATGTRAQLSGDVPAGARVGGNRAEPPTEKPATLREIGITKKQSSTAQKLADIPVDEFRDRVAVVEIRV